MAYSPSPDVETRQRALDIRQESRFNSAHRTPLKRDFLFYESSRLPA